MRRPRARRALAGLAAAAAALPALAAAQTEGRLSADASVTGGYANNPFTSTGGGTGTGVVTLDFAPRYELATPRSTLAVIGDVNVQQYVDRYGRNVSYSGGLDYRTRLSERVTGHARVDLSSSVLGTFNSYLPLAATTPAYAPTLGSAAAGTGTAATGPTGAGNATDPALLLPVAAAPAPLVPYTDVGLYGLGSRRRSVQGAGDLSFVLGPRDSLTASGFAQVTRYSSLGIGFGTGDFEGYGGSAGFQHRVSSRLSLGVTGSAATYQYHNGAPSSQVYSVQATASGQFNERWSASGALGVSFVSGDPARSTTATSLSGNADVCRRGPHSSLCLQLARSVAPTGVAGSQYVTSAGLAWNRQLDARQNLSLGASYSKVGGDAPLYLGAPVLQTEYVQATAGYYRRLRARLGLVASANYRKLLNNSFGRGADYGGQVGLSYHLGNAR